MNKKEQSMTSIPKEAKSFVEANLYNWNDEPKVYLASQELKAGIPIIVDLFCGMGGLSLGFEMAGFQTALGVDIHKPSIETFVNSHPTASAILGDIRKIMPLEGKRGDNLVESVLSDMLGDTQDNDIFTIR
jgi:uncharacterized iron-regulated protein